MKRVGVYVRVSTDDQNLVNQVQVLTDVARQRDWQIVEVYSDQGISGAKGKDNRPGFRKLCKDASQGKFDTVACWAVDRLSRSLQDLVSFFGEMAAINVGLYIHQQAVDSARRQIEAHAMQHAHGAKLFFNCIEAHRKAHVTHSFAK